MLSSFLVFPSKQTGNSRRIELAGFDLWKTACINNVFVYPSEIKVDRFKEALSRTLSIWSLVAGHVRISDDEHYFIEMSDKGIPVTLVSNTDLKKWPIDSTVIVELNENLLAPFIDEVKVDKIFDNTEDVPLVHFKLTHIVQSGEWIIGVSWSHVLGDAAANLHFLHTLSSYYQQKEPDEPSPIFERRLWKADEANESFLPLMKQQRDAKPTEEIIKVFLDDQKAYDPVVLKFSSEQLAKLASLAGGKSITIQDSLTAYIILTLNKNCYYDNDERRILRTNTAVNCRGVSNDISPKGQVSNALIMMLSDDFDDPYSLTNIAATIRQSITKSRDAEYLKSWIATADKLMRNNMRNNKLIDMGLFSNEIVVNSNFRYDWAGLVDFGYKDKCRFHTVWSGALYLRVFRLNPVCENGKWLPRDCNGAEVSFRMEKHLKERFIQAWKRDVIENFENIRK